MYGEDERFPTPRRRRGYYPMVRMFGSDLPKEFENLTKVIQGPTGDVRERVGPFVYGFSYTSSPGEEPIFQEFGNIRPTDSGLQPIVGLTPMVDINDKGDFYEILVELPGVEKNDIDLDFYEDSFVIDTSGDKKYRGRTVLKVPVNPNKAEASYKNGVLYIKVEKAEEYKPSKAIGTKVPVE